MYIVGSTQIAPHALTCMRLLGELAVIVQDPAYQLQDQLRSADVQDAMGRYKVWGGNLGAFISSTKSRRSLQYRLREATQVRDQVIKLLTRLSSSLERAVAIVAGHAPNRPIEPLKIDESDSDDGKTPSESGSSISQLSIETRYELQDLFQAAENTIGNLLRLSVIIHKPIPKDRYARLATLDPIDDKYDQNHVWEKYPYARSSPWLIERIGKANAKRRQYFIYRERHREKLSQGVVEETRLPVERSHELQSNRDTPTHNVDAEFHSQPSGQRSRETFPSTAATTLILKPSTNTELIPNDGDSENGQSMTSFATSVGEGSDSHVQFPPQPEASMNGKEFECPYCWTIITVKNWQAWKKHVIRDLQPYTCSSEACVLRMFSSRAAWFEHEMQAHRKAWFCMFCERENKTQEQLLRHMQKQHGETVMEAQTATLLKSCERPVEGISSSACPFCDDWKVSSNDAAQLSAEIHVTPAQFRRHLGKHLEQISLFALPKRHDGEDDGNDVHPDSNQALENSSLDSNANQLEQLEELEEVDLGQIRLADWRRRIKRIRSQKMRTFMDTMVSADSRLLDQLQLLWEQALVKRTSHHGLDHPHTIELIEDLATLYEVQKKWDLLIRLRREALRRISKDENASISQITTDYDRTIAFVLLMKAYRDQGATIALDNLRMNLMRQTHVSQSYPTICNTAYTLLYYGFLSEGRELCTRAKEMVGASNHPPEICVLAQILLRADMDDDAEILGYHLTTVLEKNELSLINKESIAEISTLARTFIRKGKPVIGNLLKLAAMALSAGGSAGNDMTSKHESTAASPSLAASKVGVDNPPSPGDNDHAKVDLGTNVAHTVPLAQQNENVKESIETHIQNPTAKPQPTEDTTIDGQTQEDYQSNNDSRCASLRLAVQQGNTQDVLGLLQLYLISETTAGMTHSQKEINWGAEFKPFFRSQKWPLNDAADGLLDLAVKAGSEDLVRMLLALDVEISTGHALRTAVELDAQGIVKCLLDHSLSENGLPLYHTMQPTLLAISARNGSLAMTELLIERGFSPRWCQSSLLAAASQGFSDLTSRLLQNGASLSYRNILGYTALAHAALVGQTEIVELLLQHDPAQYLAVEALIAAASTGMEGTFDILWRFCEPGEIMRVGSGTIVAAAKVGCVGIMRTVLHQRGLFELWSSETDPTAIPPPLEYQASDFHPPMFNGVEAGARYDITDACVAACFNGHVEIVQLLIGNGTRKASEQEVSGAIRGRQYGMIEYLFSSIGAEMSPGIFQLAAEEGDVRMCQILLEKVTLGNKHKIHLGTCLATAAKKGNVNLVEEFLRKGGELGISEQLNTSLVVGIAIENGHAPTAMCLIHSQPSFTVENTWVRHSLSLAVEKGFANVIDLLLRKGVEMDFERQSCYNLLYNAHKHFHPKILEILLQSGRNPLTSGLETAIGMSISHQHTELRQFLVSRRNKLLSIEQFDCQDVRAWFKVFGTIQTQNMISHDDTTVLDLTQIMMSRDDTTVLDLLSHTDVHVRIEELNQTGHALLWSALITASPKVVLKLISLGADVNLEGLHGKRPLHMAASMGYDVVVEALLTAGADPHLEDDNAMSPLDAGIASKSISVVHCLIDYGTVVDLRTMVMIILKYDVNVVPLERLIHGWETNPVYQRIKSRLEKAEVKVELLRCILQVHLADWLKKFPVRGISVLDDPSKGQHMDEAAYTELETKIHEQWLSTEDESGDHPFRRTLNRLLNKHTSESVVDEDQQSYNSRNDSMPMEEASSHGEQSHPIVVTDSYKRAYKLLVLRREIKFAKAELSKKQAEIKETIARDYNRRNFKSPPSEVDHDLHDLRLEWRYFPERDRGIDIWRSRSVLQEERGEGSTH